MWGWGWGVVKFGIIALEIIRNTDSHVSNKQKVKIVSERKDQGSIHGGGQMLDNALSSILYLVGSRFSLAPPIRPYLPGHSNTGRGSNSP